MKKHLIAAPYVQIIPPTCHEYKREARCYVIVFSGRSGKSEPSGVTEMVTIDPTQKKQVRLLKIPQDGRYQHIEIYRTVTDYNSGITDYRLVDILGMGARQWVDTRKNTGKKLIYH